MRLFFILLFLVSAELCSQQQSNSVLYDVQKVYIQLNDDDSETVISSSDKLLLLQNRNNFSIWSARDKRKMYTFYIDGEKIKGILTPNSKNIIFFLKKKENEAVFIGNLEVATGIYNEKEITNKDFIPLDLTTTFKFNAKNEQLTIFCNSKLWEFNLPQFTLKELLSFDKKLTKSYIDFLLISDENICFKIESDKKHSYYSSQLRPSEWKLDSIMLFNKTSKNLSKVKIDSTAIGAYADKKNTILIDYQHKISSLDIFNLNQKNYPKKENLRIYKTLKEKENTLLLLGDKDLKKTNEFKTDSLQTAFKKSNEKDIDTYLNRRNLSPYNLLQIDIIDADYSYKKGTINLPMKFYWDPCPNYFSSNFGIIFEKLNGIFSFYTDIEKSQRWNVDYTRESLSIHEGLTLNNKGDFTFFGYDGLEVINLTNDELEENQKSDLKLTNKFFLQNQNVLSVYAKEEKNKKLIQIELKNEKGTIIWKSDLIDSKIKEEINVNIYLNHVQSKAFINISPLYYSENNKSYTFLLDLNKNTISNYNYDHGFKATENFSYASGFLSDYINVYSNNSKTQQEIRDVTFLTTLENDNIIYKAYKKANYILKGQVSDGGIKQNFKYSLPIGSVIKDGLSPFYFIQSKKLLTGVNNRELFFWNLNQEKPVKSVVLNYQDATFITGSEKQLFVYYKNGFIDIIDLKSLEIITSFTIHKKDENIYKAFFTDDLKFFIPKDIIKEYHFVKDFETFPLVSYELFLNRPDIILSKLGYTNSKLVEVYKNAYLKRLENSGYSEKTDYLSLKKPQISLLNRDSISSISKLNLLNLHIASEADSLCVYINGVPVLKNKPLQKKFKESILLSNGVNKITLIGINKEGIQSEPVNLEITYENDEKPNVYYFGIGVSNYLDETMNLKFADKDVRSLSKLFKTKFEGRIHIDTLNNVNATKENILAFKKQLAKTTINDIVIISFSGHGLVDDSNGFYFATHDIDFKDPKAKGLSYTDIQHLVENIPARKKLLLIDACHSGELDAQELKESVKKVENVTAYIPIGAKGTITSSKKSNFKTSYEIMKSSFNTTNRGNGSFIISAAGGKEYAFESKKWGNGVFTYSFIKAMNELMLDKYNNKQPIQISMLKDYIYKSVKELTNNQQKPTSRSENLELDWVLFE